MFSIKQLITIISILSLSHARRFLDQHLDTSDLEKIQANANKRSDSPHGGVVYVMVRCSDGSNSMEVLSQYLPDTSIEAVAPMMQHWNDLAQKALDDMQCENGEEALVRLEGFNHLREKRANDPEPGLVEWIARCSDGGNSKTVVSVYMEDTSTDAISHMSQLLDKFLEEAGQDVKCADGKPATIKAQATSGSGMPAA